MVGASARPLAHTSSATVTPTLPTCAHCIALHCALDRTQLLPTGIQADRHALTIPTCVHSPSPPAACTPGLKRQGGIGTNRGSFGVVNLLAPRTSEPVWSNIFTYTQVRGRPRRRTLASMEARARARFAGTLRYISAPCGRAVHLSTLRVPVVRVHAARSTASPKATRPPPPPTH